MTRAKPPTRRQRAALERVRVEVAAAPPRCRCRPATGELCQTHYEPLNAQARLDYRLSHHRGPRTGLREATA